VKIGSLLGIFFIFFFFFSYVQIPAARKISPFSFFYSRIVGHLYTYLESFNGTLFYIIIGVDSIIYFYFTGHSTYFWVGGRFGEDNFLNTYKITRVYHNLLIKL